MSKEDDKYIFIVRHGQSEGNVDETVHQKKADWQIELSELGHQQARKAGEFMEAYLQGPELIGKKLCAWRSPYKRTRQTHAGIMRSMEPFVENVYETDKLREQEQGLWDGLTDAEKERLYPNEWKNYRKNTGEDWLGKYFARYFGGESGADVALRVAQFQESLFRDINEGQKYHFITSHGATNRIFVQQFMHYPFEWLAKEPNPGNCHIRLIKGNKIDGYKDMGYIYTGQQAEIDAAKKNMVKTK